MDKMKDLFKSFPGLFYSTSGRILLLTFVDADFRSVLSKLFVYLWCVSVAVVVFLLMNFVIVVMFFFINHLFLLSLPI